MHPHPAVWLSLALIALAVIPYLGAWLLEPGPPPPARPWDPAAADDVIAAAIRITREAAR